MLWEETWEEERARIRAKDELATRRIEGKARRYAAEDERLAAWYAVAIRATARIPYRDREDVMQEIITAYLEKNPTEDYMMALIAKEKIVQYWRRGKIENRNYRNLLLTRFYYTGIYTVDYAAGKIHEEDKPKKNWRWHKKYTGRVNIRTKYIDEDGETSIYIEEELSDNGQQAEYMVDRVFFNSLPKRIQEICLKKSQGYALSGAERKALYDFRKKLIQQVTV